MRRTGNKPSYSKGTRLQRQIITSNELTMEIVSLRAKLSAAEARSDKLEREKAEAVKALEVLCGWFDNPSPEPEVIAGRAALTLLRGSGEKEKPE